MIDSLPDCLDQVTFNVFWWWCGVTFNTFLWVSRRLRVWALSCWTLYTANGERQAIQNFSSGCVEWPPFSPGFILLDLFLWGCMKEKIYETPIRQCCKNFRRRITDACASMTPMIFCEMCWREIKRIYMSIVADGQRFEHRQYMFILTNNFLFLTCFVT